MLDSKFWLTRHPSQRHPSKQAYSWLHHTATSKTATYTIRLPCPMKFAFQKVQGKLVKWPLNHAFLFPKPNFCSYVCLTLSIKSRPEIPGIPSLPSRKGRAQGLHSPHNFTVALHHAVYSPELVKKIVLSSLMVFRSSASYNSKNARAGITTKCLWGLVTIAF